MFCKIVSMLNYDFEPFTPRFPPKMSSFYKQTNTTTKKNGVVITTYAQRDKQKKMLTAPTLPSIVHQTGINSLEITIFEGRNRQIRKMLEALGYTVVMLHRVEFMKIGLEPLEREGDWAELSLEEMKMIDELIA